MCCKPYIPRPIDTAKVNLPPELLSLCEQLAKNTHEQWAARRMAAGWVWGPERNDTKKEHPLLIPYEALPESEKEYDRSTSIETVKLLLQLGYRIEKEE